MNFGIGSCKKQATFCQGVVTTIWTEQQQLPSMDWKLKTQLLLRLSLDDEDLMIFFSTNTSEPIASVWNQRNYHLGVAIFFIRTPKPTIMIRDENRTGSQSNPPKHVVLSTAGHDTIKSCYLYRYTGIANRSRSKPSFSAADGCKDITLT